jgi:hypothetical protein
MIQWFRKALLHEDFSKQLVLSSDAGYASSR